MGGDPLSAHLSPVFLLLLLVPVFEKEVRKKIEEGGEESGGLEHLILYSMLNASALQMAGNNHRR